MDKNKLIKKAKSILNGTYKSPEKSSNIKITKDSVLYKKCKNQ